MLDYTHVRMHREKHHYNNTNQFIGLGEFITYFHLGHGQWHAG
jgi:hypothetical protein